MRNISHHLRLIAVLLALTGLVASHAAVDTKNDKTYLMLLDSMRRGFNEADSARFFPAVEALESYLLRNNDLHLYYTQRCNEIVFQMNRQKIYEAYKMARQLSRELSERKLDKEMYMAYNMMGHIYRFCGNKDAAVRCFRRVLGLMKESGYPESMPPIYMNMVNVMMETNPFEAFQLIEDALNVSRQYSPDRVFDIESRRTAAYYEVGDTARFLEGYEAYRQGLEQGHSTVHGRELEVYYLAIQGKIDEALAKSREEFGDENYDALIKLLCNAGRWQEAFEMQKLEFREKDSVNSVLLSNSMQGIQDDQKVYDAERRATRNSLIALVSVVVLLSCLIAMLAFLMFNRRRHMKQLNKAYQHALESDNLKSAFIRNVSHEIRTPLNIISGFAQVMSDPQLDASSEERRHMTKMMQTNTNIITALIDEMLELSQNESGGEVCRDDTVRVNALLRELIHSESQNLTPDTTIRLDTSLSDAFTMRTNQSMLRRIVGALLNNAIKYTDQGTITLKASEGGGQLTLIVEDTGRGVPSNESEHIFDRFVKLDSFKVGIGLGLPLCRSNARKLGGSVMLDTTFAGPGARFIVTLPLEMEPDQEDEEENE